MYACNCFRNEICLPVDQVERSPAPVREHGKEVSKYKLAAAHYSWMGQSPSYGPSSGSEHMFTDLGGHRNKPWSAPRDMGTGG
jgi:hypothetical protein